jgi:NADH-quinone oxidoreductase subunit I
VAYDIRKAEPYCIYDRFDFDIPDAAKSDIYDRYYIRLLEARESIKILQAGAARHSAGRGQRLCFSHPEPGLWHDHGRQGRLQFPPEPEGEAYARIEAPKGELGYYVVSDNKANPYRYHVRSPSYINLNALGPMSSATSGRRRRHPGRDRHRAGRSGSLKNRRICMFGTGLLKGLGITLKHFTDTFTDDRRRCRAAMKDSIQLDEAPAHHRTSRSRRRVAHDPIPGRARLLPERFRYIPMLIWDTEKNEDRCTACGICAKVCPPQCIWIVRDKDENGKPVTRPAEFYIDVAVCMSCSFCTEFCPFDAIKMNHDYELASMIATRSSSTTRKS